MSSSIQSSARYISQTRRILAIKIVALVTIALILVSYSAWGEDSLAANAISAAGLCLIIAAVIGRLWATLYIGWRKNATLITSGPYSITRNPLYVFSIVGAAGIGLVFGSLVIAGVLSVCIAVLLAFKARDEAAMLGARFGATYQAYAARVPLLWPRRSLYQDTDAPSFQPRALHRALRDGLLFLLAAPAAELVAYAKKIELLPQLIVLF